MAESSKQPFEVRDFSMGLTDNAFESDPRYAVQLDNVNVEPDGSLRSRIGSLVEDTANPQIPAGIERIGALINYDNSTKLLVQSETKFYYRNPSAYATLQGPTSNDVFSIGASTNNTSFSEWNKQLFVTNDGFPRPMKIYKDSGGVYRVRTSGLPALANAPTVTPVAGANSYIYAFHYYYSYTVGSQTFEDVGPVEQVQITSAAAPNISTVAITVIPVLANGVTDNWDTSVLKVNIYRTTNGGTTFFYVGQVTNGTTTYNDTSSDATIQANAQALLYTTGGVVDFDPAPLHKFIHIVNNIGYYGFIKEGSVEYPFKLRQSIPASPSSCPVDFEIDLEDEIKGLGSVVSVPIVFCKRHVYRLAGNFDEFGRGGINPIRISDTAGCVSNLSIVSAEGSIFWAGNDGFYTSDGYNVKKISDKLNSRYKALLDAADDQKRIYGKFDEANRRIIWAVQANAASDENDSFVVLDLRWGIRDNSTFTTWSGTSFRPSAIEFFNGKLYRADNSGYVYYHDEDTMTDPRVATSVAAANWEKETIIWLYESCSADFGSRFYRKMPTRILVVARNIGNTSIQITAIDDDGKRERALKIIRWRRNFVWGDENFVWGNPDCIWNSIGVIEQWRRYPAKGLRVSYIRTRITNAYSVVSNSDTIGTAIFAGGANTATLTNAGASDWPTDAVDYFISTEFDNYVTQYKVLSKTADVLTLIDPGNNLPTGTLKWVLSGYRKGEPINLQGYVIHTANVDQMQLTYEAGDDGANS